jgi:hypothetical protein
MSSGHRTQGHSRVLFQSKNIDVLTILLAVIYGHVPTLDMTFACPIWKKIGHVLKGHFHISYQTSYKTSRHNEIVPIESRKLAIKPPPAFPFPSLLEFLIERERMGVRSKWYHGWNHNHETNWTIPQSNRQQMQLSRRLSTQKSESEIPLFQNYRKGVCNNLR